MPTIICLDANANPFGEGTSDEPSVWKSFLENQDVASVWEGHLNPEVPPVSHGGVGREAPVSVNKMRGPLSDQPSKIGLHAYQLIDHIFYSRNRLYPNSKNWAGFKHALEPKAVYPIIHLYRIDIASHTHYCIYMRIIAD